MLFIEEREYSKVKHGYLDDSLVTVLHTTRVVIYCSKINVLVLIRTESGSLVYIEITRSVC